MALWETLQFPLWFLLRYLFIHTFKGPRTTTQASRSICPTRGHTRRHGRRYARIAPLRHPPPRAFPGKRLHRKLPREPGKVKARSSTSPPCACHRTPVLKPPTLNPKPLQAPHPEPLNPKRKTLKPHFGVLCYGSYLQGDCGRSDQLSAPHAELLQLTWLTDKSLTRWHFGKL